MNQLAWASGISSALSNQLAWASSSGTSWLICFKSHANHQQQRMQCKTEGEDSQSGEKRERKVALSSKVITVDRLLHHFFCWSCALHNDCNILEISTRNFWKRCILNDYIYIGIIQCICLYVLGRSRNSGGKIHGLG